MWTKPLLKTKAKAMLIHMSLSSVVFLPLLYLILTRWYPGPLFLTDGGWQGTRIMLLVDMVLGPTLTFMVYNAAKSRLALTVDFTFIGIVQVVALAYGAMNIETSRIWTIAYNTTFDSFMAVSKNSYDGQQIPEDGWKRFGDAPQYWVFVRSPKLDEMPAVIAGGDRGIPFEAEYFLYQPLSEVGESLFKHELNMPKLGAMDPELNREYQAFLNEHAAAEGGLHFFRLAGFYRSVIVAIDGKTRYVGYLSSDVPWGKRK